MIKIEIPTAKIETLYDAIAYNNGDGFDISDDTWDWGTYFSCELKWSDCDDYYDRCMLLFALNIEIIKMDKDWYSCCKVAEFMWDNKKAFSKFFDEENREGYRPMDYEDIDPDEDSGFFEAYMESMESLLVGNYSESDYEKLFKLLTEGIDLSKIDL